MEGQLLAKCILCLNTISVEDRAEENTEQDGNIEKRKGESVFLEFCKCYNIHLPVGRLSWDFDNELPPICEDCQVIAGRLVNLREELKTLQKLLEETEKFVRDRICESDAKLLCRDDVVGDYRILAVRDLIRGPTIYLEKVPVPSELVQVKAEPASDDDELGGHLGSDTGSLNLTEDEELNDPHDSGVEWVGDFQPFVSKRRKAANTGSRRAKGTRKVDGANRKPKVQKSRRSKGRPTKRNGDQKISKARKGPSARSDLSSVEPLGCTSALVKTEEPTSLSVPDESSKKLHPEIPGDMKVLPSDVPHEGLQGEPLLIVEEEEFGDTENRRNPPRRKRPSKYFETIDVEPIVTIDEESDFGNDAAKGTTSMAVEPGEMDTENDDKVRESVDEEDEDGSDEFVDDDFEDDPTDKDFILPDDTVEEMKKDEKLGAKVMQTLASRIRAKLPKERPANQRVPPKLEKVDGNRYVYGGFQITGVKGNFRCPLCENLRFGRVTKATLHIREIHMGWFNKQCDLCGITFISSGSFYQHRRDKHPTAITPVMCEFCGKEFKNEKRLKPHLANAHNDNYKEVCGICGKRFKFPRALSLHVRGVHQNEKRFFCEMCGRGFFSATTLKLHLSTHSVERAFECKHCGQKLNRKTYLQRHMQQFHSSLTSQESTASTSETAPANAAPPNAPTTVDNPEEVMCTETLKCKICGLQYNRQNNLTRHIKQIHHINVKGYAWKSRGHRNWERKRPAVPARLQTETAAGPSASPSEEDPSLVGSGNDDLPRIPIHPSFISSTPQLVNFIQPPPWLGFDYSVGSHVPGPLNLRPSQPSRIQSSPDSVHTGQPDSEGTQSPQPVNFS